MYLSRRDSWCSRKGKGKRKRGNMNGMVSSEGGGARTRRQPMHRLASQRHLGRGGGMGPWTSVLCRKQCMLSTVSALWTGPSVVCGLQDENRRDHPGSIPCAGGKLDTTVLRGWSLAPCLVCLQHSSSDSPGYMKPFVFRPGSSWLTACCCMSHGSRESLCCLHAYACHDP